MAEPAKREGEGGGGEHIGPFRIIRTIARGGQGTVYLAQQDEPINREVAVKVSHEVVGSGEAAYRFHAEREALSRMQHPNVATVLDAGTTVDGRPYLAMEYVSGTRVTTYCDEARLTLRERIGLFQQLCEGVHHAHQKGLIHRDLKPDNILVSVQLGPPLVKLVDFGLARSTDVALTSQKGLSKAGSPIGTPVYMSPEQAGASHGDVDIRTDVYSLGVVLYELLAGEPPFTSAELERAGILEMGRIIREQDPPRPGSKIGSPEVAAGRALARRTTTRGLHHVLGGDLQWVVLKCLEKDRNRRYPSALALAEDLDNHLQNRPIRAAPPSTAYQFRKWVLRHQTLAVGLVLLAASFVVIAYFYLDAERERAAVQRLADLTLAQVFVGEFESSGGFVIRRANVESMTRWVGEVEPLLTRLARHEKTVAASGDALMALWNQRKENPFSTFREKLEPYLPEVRSRITSAERVYRESVVEMRARWQEVSDSVERDSRFKLRIPPQEGLVPISPDPRTRLWEFGHPLSGRVPVRVDGRLEIDRESSLVFVLVPAGQFTMGAPERDKDARPFERPDHVKSVKAFFISKYELTESQWKRISGQKSPNTFGFDGWRECLLKAQEALVDKPDEVQRLFDLRPVDFVSWLDCHRVLEKVYLRMPTEARWEYAARAGVSSPWPTGWSPTGIEKFANLMDEAMRKVGYNGTLTSGFDGYPLTAPVNALEPNGFGLYNVLGNVEEWTADLYYDYTKAPDESAPRVSRGGSYYEPPEKARYSVRQKHPENFTSHTLGVRPSRELIMESATAGPPPK